MHHLVISDRHPLPKISEQTPNRVITREATVLILINEAVLKEVHHQVIVNRGHLLLEKEDRLLVVTEDHLLLVVTEDHLHLTVKDLVAIGHHRVAATDLRHLVGTGGHQKDLNDRILLNITDGIAGDHLADLVRQGVPEVLVLEVLVTANLDLEVLVTADLDLEVLVLEVLVIADLDLEVLVQIIKRKTQVIGGHPLHRNEECTFTIEKQ